MSPRGRRRHARRGRRAEGQGDQVLPDDLLFAALVEPIARRQAPIAATGAEGAEDEDADGAVDQLLRAADSYLATPSRRIADRVRQLLSAQKVLTGERRRRRGLARLSGGPRTSLTR